MFRATSTCRRCVCSFLRPQQQPLDEEAAFLHQHQIWLPQSAVVFIVLSIVGHAAVLLENWRLEGHRHDHPFVWEMRDARFASFAWWIIAIWLNMIGTSCICGTKLMQLEYATKIAEYTLAALSVVVCIGTPLLNRRSGPVLMGADPREIWIQSVDHVETASAMLVFTYMVVVSALPIRCRVVLVHHVIVAVSNVAIQVCFNSFSTGMNLMVITVAGCSFASAHRIESLTRQSWTTMRKSQADAEGAQSELERQQATTDAIRSAFRVLFDVVLHMGDTFTVAGGDCSFRGVFGEVDNTIAIGQRLTDFFPPGDGDRLRDLAHNASNLSVPQLMATTLINSAGGYTRPAEIFLADTKLDGDHKYLVGLRFPPLPLDNDPLPNDPSDQAPLDVTQVVQREEATGNRRRGHGHAERRLPDVVRRLDNGVDVSSTTSDNTHARSLVPFCIRSDEIAAIINSGTQDYKIKACSASFADQFEPNPVGQAFSSWVVESDMFGCWLEHQTNALLYSEGDFRVSPSLQLTLRPPSRVARGMEFSVWVKIAIEHSADAIRVHEDYLLVKVMMDRVRWRLIQDGGLDVYSHPL